MIPHSRRSGHDLSSLLTVVVGGAPRAPEQVRQIAASFGNARPGIGWGMTETNAIGTSISGADYLARLESSGRCSLVLDLSIRDDAGRELPPGQSGELWVRGTSVFRGYWNLPEATAAAFVGDWFRTGDGAYLDDEGFVCIVDRLKDLIIRGGENIGCDHVEAALLMHPAVREASVYAVPEPRRDRGDHGQPGCARSPARGSQKAAAASIWSRRPAAPERMTGANENAVE